MKLKSKLFEGLDQEETSRLKAIAVKNEAPDDRRLIAKGESQENIFVLIEGQFEVYDLEGDNRYVLASLNLRGDFVGEQSFLGKSANMNVTVARGSKYFSIDISKMKGDPLLCQKLLINLTAESCSKLEEANHSLVEQFKEAIVASKTLALCLSSVGLSMFFLSFTTWINFQSNALWSWLFIVAVLPPPIVFIISTRQSFADFGVTIKNARQSLKEGALLSVLLLAFLSLIAYSVSGITHVSVPKIFSMHNYIGIGFYIYFAHCYMQEFFARGVLQTSLFRIMGRSGSKNNNAAPAIFFAAVVFSILHYPLGFPSVLATFVSGLFFGYLYQRHKNLLGVSLVHFITGEFFFGFYYAMMGADMVS